MSTREEQLLEKEARLKGLLLKGLAGDAKAYQTFLEELSMYLRRFIRKRLSYLPDEVEDLVQESLLAIHNQRHTYDSGSPVSAWVQAIARYKLIDMLRRRSLKDSLTEPLDEDAEFYAATESQADEARRDLVKLLEELPDQQRLPIMYTKLKGFSVKEAAGATGMSESAIKVGVHRGLKFLAEKLRGEGCRPMT